MEPNLPDHSQSIHPNSDAQEPCDLCQRFFQQFRCNAPEECDCPKCQGMCVCPAELTMKSNPNPLGGWQLAAAICEHLARKLGFGNLAIHSRHGILLIEWNFRVGNDWISHGCAVPTAMSPSDIEDHARWLASEWRENARKTGISARLRSIRWAKTPE